MNLENIHRIYFVGIGGIGMSALARWFKKQGKTIAGYDRTRTSLCQQLESEGMEISYEDQVQSIPETFKQQDPETLVIFTPAIPPDQTIFCYFRQNQFQVKKRSEVLGTITRNHFTIAIAGTHGKTTTSTLIAHIVKEANLNSVAFLGGIATNYQSNLIINENPEDRTLKVIVEADEYDRSFLTLRPDIAVITALDPDHLDIYGDEVEMKSSYSEFVNHVKKNGFLIIRKNLKNEILSPSNQHVQIKEYSLKNNPVRAENVRIEKEETRFNYVCPETVIENIPYAFPGYHNIENAVAAITVGLLLDIREDIIKSALSTFRGIRRRFEYILYSDNLVFIDDYAHHPEEIRAFLHSVRSIFPEQKITAIFQPHLFTRTRDFAKSFGETLDLADEVILLDIYPAREKPLPGVSSDLIFEKIKSADKTKSTREGLFELLKQRDVEVLVTIGAGDIDQLVLPIMNLLKEKYEIPS
ncbi:MAG: UDP-N-acetylmuramate--L-alanine ligase [Cyclobacteriaceae bacterium]|nr:UDP-N-acetylmuramate--L-alanine ligase [Cyclobacteriaceae bacterium]